MTPAASTTRLRGRPRGFDKDAALEAAMKAFWASGYDAASVDSLCRQMNMPRASLYQEYTDKEGLFLAAVDHYGRTRLAPVAAALGPMGSLHDDLAAFFDAVVRLGTCASDPRGCLISCVLSDAAATNATFRAELERRYTKLEHKIIDRLRADGWPEDGANPPTIVAGLVAAMARGIILRARSGQGADQLRPIGRTAARALQALDTRSSG